MQQIDLYGVLTSGETVDIFSIQSKLIETYTIFQATDPVLVTLDLKFWKVYGAIFIDLTFCNRLKMFNDTNNPKPLKIIKYNPDINGSECKVHLRNHSSSKKIDHNRLDEMALCSIGRLGIL